jgi:hypothetical protein
MEAGSPNASNAPYSTLFYVGLSALIALAVGITIWNVVIRSKQGFTGTPSISGMPAMPGMSGKQKKSEGFQGPTNGVSDISCGQESAEAVAIADLFATKKSTTGEGQRDLLEFKIILSKLCCIKHDLVSTAQVVQATMYIPYNTTHDRENPADTVARCFTKSIPPRDLEISFDTWKKRAMVLLSRLCTSYNITDPESARIKNSFDSLWMDVYSIAQGACTPPLKAPAYGSPRDPKPFLPETIEDLGPYKGYY